MKIKNIKEDCAVYMHLKQYQAPIRNTVELICDFHNEIIRAEYLSYFVLKLTQKYSYGLIEGFDEILVSADTEVTDKLSLNASKLGDCLQSNSDLSSSSHDFAYVLLSVMDGICGGSHHAHPVSFGFYAMIQGVIEKIIRKTDGRSRRDCMLMGTLRFVSEEIKRFSQGTGLYYPKRPVEWKEVNTDVVVNNPDQDWKKNG